LVETALGATAGISILVLVTGAFMWGRESLDQKLAVRMVRGNPGPRRQAFGEAKMKVSTRSLPIFRWMVRVGFIGCGISLVLAIVAHSLGFSN
jgi:hypothetical protein